MPAVSFRANSTSATGAGSVQVGRAWRTLDALNFFLADMRGGLSIKAAADQIGTSCLRGSQSTLK
jgi:hypothetical protein